eukprot:150378-Chlamydomonas_euryale.AAC.1
MQGQSGGGGGCHDAWQQYSAAHLAQEQQLGLVLFQRLLESSTSAEHAHVAEARAHVAERAAEGGDLEAVVCAHRQASQGWALSGRAPAEGRSLKASR